MPQKQQIPVLEPAPQRHTLEVVLSLAIVLMTVALILWANLDPRIGIQIAIVGEVWVFSVAILKQHFSETVQALVDQVHTDLDMMIIVSKLDGERRKYGVRRMELAREELDSIRQGRIPLCAKDYYQELNDGVDRCPKGSVVYAVSAMDPLRWKCDRNQRRWHEANVRAVTRGVNIIRIFVLRREQMASEQGEAIRAILAEQQRSQITVHVVWHDEAKKQDGRLLSDFVVFPDGAVLVDFHDKDEPLMVGAAEMLVAPNRMAFEYRQLFEEELRNLGYLFIDLKELDDSGKLEVEK